MNYPVCAKFSDDYASGRVYATASGYQVQGKTTPNATIRYWAASAPDYHLSVAGTALPFANSEIAFSSANSGTIKADNAGLFTIDLCSPNSYYTCGGRQLIPPSVNFAINFGSNAEKVYYVPLSIGYRDRSLSALPGRPDRAYDR